MNKTVLGILAVSLLMGAGLWFWMGIFGDGRPSLKNVTVTPETFRFAGGRAVVQAEVTDDQGVEEVTAVLLADDVLVLSVGLVKSSTDANNPVYAGEFQVPANLRSDGETVEYTLQLVAVDTDGQDSKKQKTIKVPAAGVPPAPPGNTD